MRAVEGTGNLIGVCREGNICEIAAELVWLFSKLVFILVEKFFVIPLRDYTIYIGSDFAYV